MRSKIFPSNSPINSLNTVGDAPGHGTRAAGEHPHLAHVAVLLLHKLKQKYLVEKYLTRKLSKKIIAKNHERNLA